MKRVEEDHVLKQVFNHKLQVALGGCPEAAGQESADRLLVLLGLGGL